MLTAHQSFVNIIYNIICDVNNIIEYLTAKRIVGYNCCITSSDSRRLAVVSIDTNKHQASHILVDIIQFFDVVPLADRDRRHLNVSERFHHFIDLAAVQRFLRQQQ